MFEVLVNSSAIFNGQLVNNFMVSGQSDKLGKRIRGILIVWSKI